MKPSKVLIWVTAVAIVSFAIGYQYGTPGGGAGSELDRRRAAADVREAVFAHERLEQAALLGPILRVMNPEDALELVETFESTFAVGGSGLPVELFVEHWGEIDPQTALERVAEWPSDRQREVLPGLIRGWARHDPQSARRALESIADPIVGKLAVEGLVDGWADSGDPGVWDYLMTLPDDRPRTLAMLRVMQQLAWREGIDGLILLVDTLPEEPPNDAFKRQAFRSAADVIARIDLDRAISFAEAQRNGKYGEILLAPVAKRLVAGGGRVGMEWIRAQPAGKARDRAMRTAFIAWERNDANAANAWLEEVGSADDVGPIHLERAVGLARTDPERAIDAASQIHDPALRRRAQREISGIWRRRDPAAADRWLREIGLTEPTADADPPVTE
jgi:hypothetical protein